MHQSYEWAPSCKLSNHLRGVAGVEPRAAGSVRTDLYALILRVAPLMQAQQSLTWCGCCGAKDSRFCTTDLYAIILRVTLVMQAQQSLTSCGCCGAKGSRSCLCCCCCSRYCCCNCWSDGLRGIYMVCACVHVCVYVLKYVCVRVFVVCVYVCASESVYVCVYVCV